MLLIPLLRILIRTGSDCQDSESICYVKTNKLKTKEAWFILTPVILGALALLYQIAFRI